MSEKAEKAVGDFVDLVEEKLEDWLTDVVTRGVPVGEDVPRQLRVLQRVVELAGFEPKEVSPGWCFAPDPVERLHLPGQFHCPFMVKGNPAATNWLDDLVGCARSSLRPVSPPTREQIIKLVRTRIEMIRPLEPIQMTKEGDMLCGSSGLSDPRHREHSELPPHGAVGIHRLCNGSIDCGPASESHNRLSCRRCNLAVVVPKVGTYGELRAFLQKAISQQV